MLLRILSLSLLVVLALASNVCAGVLFDESPYVIANFLENGQISTDDLITSKDLRILTETYGDHVVRTGDNGSRFVIFRHPGIPGVWFRANEYSMHIQALKPPFLSVDGLRRSLAYVWYIWIPALLAIGWLTAKYRVIETAVEYCRKLLQAKRPVQQPQPAPQQVAAAAPTP